MNNKGGARVGAGRVAGSKNKVPSKSVAAQAHFADLVMPRLDAYFQVLDSIALDVEKRPSDRIAATRELLDRAMGRPQQSVDITTDDARPIVTSIVFNLPEDASAVEEPTPGLSAGASSEAQS